MLSTQSYYHGYAIVCNTYFNHLDEICKLLGGLQPLAVGYLGIVKPLGIHRVELHNQICKVSSNGVLLYPQYNNRWVDYIVHLKERCSLGNGISYNSVWFPVQKV